MAAAISMFAIQLVLNVAWSGILFGLCSPGAGLLAILALWCAIAATIVTFHRIVALAGWTLTAYLAWVSFASESRTAAW